MRVALVMAIVSGWVSLNAMLCIVYLIWAGKLGGSGGRAKKKTGAAQAPAAALA